MLIAVDFDGTIVDDVRPFDDLDALKLVPGALEGLRALKAADHVLILYSARANLAHRENPSLDPLVRRKVRTIDMARWRRLQPLYRARYQEMLDFVKVHLAGIFDAIDDGRQGKPDADLFIDDRALRFNQYGGRGATWAKLADQYGERDG